MNVVMLRRARKLFNSELIPPHHNRAYQRKWVRSLRQLGDRWLLARANPLVDRPQTSPVALVTINPPT